MPSYECYFYVYHCNDISNDNKRRVINVCVCVCMARVRVKKLFDARKRTKGRGEEETGGREANAL